jgi:uncharacterized membrane protein/protein-disulfide isomerase
MTRFRQSWPWWRWVLTGLSALGLALSAYLSWHYLANRSVLGCSGANSCDDVLNSRWSTIGGVLPVSGLAAGAYFAMLTASFSIGPRTAAPVRRLAWRAMLILAGAAAGSAVWFIIVQKWFIGSFCPYCMATHITSLLLAAFVIWRAPLESDQGIRRLPVIGFALTGAALAGILAIGQLTIVPRAVYRAGESQNNLTAIDSRAAPLIGSPGAPYIVTLLFDYKCPHCQQVHLLLDEVIRRYNGKLAVALCPAPLNRECNPYVPRDVDEFADSCELAKVGLAVWVANREAFPAFDRWMFSFESGDRWHPRSLEAAKAKAIELVGQSKFDAAMTDPWINEYLQTSVRLYANSGAAALPKLVFGSRWVTPQPQDINDLVSILQDTLAVPKP